MTAILKLLIMKIMIFRNFKFSQNHLTRIVKLFNNAQKDYFLKIEFVIYIYIIIICLIYFYI